MHDPRVGRFFTIDPLARKYSHYSPYSFSGNKVIHRNEIEGLEDGALYVSHLKSEQNPELSQKHHRQIRNGILTPVKYLHNLATTFGTGLHNAAVVYIPREFGFEGGEEASPYLWKFDDAGYQYYNTDLKWGTYQLQEQVAGDAVGLIMETIPLPGLGRITSKVLKSTVGRKVLKYTVEPWMNLAQKKATRRNFATLFYEQAGYAGEKASSHVNGIDLAKPVQKVTLEKGTVVQQWVGPRGVGNYFTTLENGASKNLGIDYSNRTLKTFKLKENVEVLKSTARTFQGNKGGGTQFFGGSLRNNVEEIP